MSTRNLIGSIYLANFRVVYDVPALSANKQNVLINYKGYGNPEQTSDIIKYKYSLDSGLTWNDMTPSASTVLSGLSFTLTGNDLMFEWEARTDIGTQLFNNSIKIVLQAQSGSMVTNEAFYTLYFEKIQTNQLSEKRETFNDSYSGVPGNELMVNAPKSF